MTIPPVRGRIFSRPSWPEATALKAALRTETVGGALLLLAALLAIAWANSPWHESYAALRDLSVGVDWGHLKLTLGHWAADGLLAIFFFVAGLELKREFLVGDLRDPRRAAVPIVAAVCGVIVPAATYLIVTRATGGTGDALRGWAIPSATDIAFALAVLAVLGSHLPAALRAFLLTLAVVDDLIAIVIIAIGYTSDFAGMPLLLAVAPLAAFTFLVQRRITYPLLLVPLALLTWGLVHASGVHATVAGVLLGLVVPVRPRKGRMPAVSVHGPKTDVAHVFEHRLRPLSAALAVPVFAFFAAGVRVVGGGFGEAISDPVALGVMAGLVIGKVVGVFGGTYLTARFTKADLDPGLGWADVVGLSFLTGIGFTVSLLIGELAFGAGSDRDEHVKLAVLLGSLAAAALAALVLVPRNARYRAAEAREEQDDDGDGIPDVYEYEQTR
ncbi:Na+/H+ antiporter NhaA [Nostocoides australiense]|nr:Na+/H+ antiporter NhaA [Tetrasphaera sp.]HPF79750.1 Na+/H+ antiporter NhaA [Tetrasphaera australiensis]